MTSEKKLAQFVEATRDTDFLYEKPDLGYGSFGLPMTILVAQGITDLFSTVSTLPTLVSKEAKQNLKNVRASLEKMREGQKSRYKGMWEVDIKPFFEKSKHEKLESLWRLSIPVLLFLTSANAAFTDFRTIAISANQSEESMPE